MDGEEYESDQLDERMGSYESGEEGDMERSEEHDPAHGVSAQVADGPEEDGEDEDDIYDGNGGDPIGDTDAFANVAQGLSGPHRDQMLQYWQDVINGIEQEEHSFKVHQLPLARIKKVMKADEDVKMISAEAPILFAKGCDIFITELTMRAWIHAEENKRRTLQRSDIAAALQRSDMFDFLIDIVPREEAHGRRAPPSSAQSAHAGGQYEQHSGGSDGYSYTHDGQDVGTSVDHQSHYGGGGSAGAVDFNGYRQF
jgi:histone H3/H4